MNNVIIIINNVYESIFCFLGDMLNYIAGFRYVIKAVAVLHGQSSGNYYP